MASNPTALLASLSLSNGDALSLWPLGSLALGDLHTQGTQGKPDFTHAVWNWKSYPHM